MLIHVTRFTLVQGHVQELVERELKRLVNKIRSDTGLDELKELWEKDFVPTTNEMKSEFGCNNTTWEKVQENLYPIAKRIKVKSSNGSSKESLDYRVAEMEAQQRKDSGEEVPWEEEGKTSFPLVVTSFPAVLLWMD